MKMISIGLVAASTIALLAGCGEPEIKEGDHFSLFLEAEGEAMRMEYNLSMGECSDRLAQETDNERQNQWNRKWYCERQEGGYAI